MLAILAEDEYNDAYGRVRMYQALEFRKEQGKTNIHKKNLQQKKRSLKNEKKLDYYIGSLYGIFSFS